jgi:carboxylesterase type B
MSGEGSGHAKTAMRGARGRRASNGAAARPGGPESRAETAKIARLLGVKDADALAYLHTVDAAELIAYREAVVAALYDDGREQLQRVADAARLLPARVLAKIGERALGPLICARLAGLIEPRRAVEISEHFSLEFLARLAAELDPRRAVDVLSALDADRVVAIALAMAAQGERVAMGRFVAHLERGTLAECIERLENGDVLRVAFVAEGSKAQGRIFDAAGVRRMRAVLDAAQAAGLEEEAGFFVEHLNASQRTRLHGARSD